MEILCDELAVINDGKVIVSDKKYKNLLGLLNDKIPILEFETSKFKILIIEKNIKNKKFYYS